MQEKQKECPSCALEVDATAEVCPYCEYECPKQRSSLKWAAILLALLLVWPVVNLIMRLFE